MWDYEAGDLVIISSSSGASLPLRLWEDCTPWYLWNLQTMSHWKKLKCKHRINIKCHQSPSVDFITMFHWMLFPCLNYHEQTLVMSSISQPFPLFHCIPATPLEKEKKISIKFVMAELTGISRLPQLSVPVMAGDVLPAPLPWKDIYTYI